MKSLLTIIALCTALLISQPAMSAGAPVLSQDSASRDDDEQRAALEASRAGEILSYKKVRRIAEKQLKAKVIGERLRRTNNGWVYEFRARSKKGRIIHAIYSAKDGKLIARR